MSISREDILVKVKEIMNELFELKPESIQLESRLSEDLGLDSIDAIDLITFLQSFVGQRLQPEDFRSVRTISDLITAAETTLNQVKHADDKKPGV
ncbi:Acyl carrier protein [compost metagenome]